MENIKILEQLERPWVVAHRGYRALYPENTLVAFEAAIGVNDIREEEFMYNIWW